MPKLPRTFYDRDTEQVARELLGCTVVHRTAEQERAGRIVEVEAYVGPHDLAAHTSKGRTPRTRVMFGPPGYLYVYLIYGMHHCMNVVTEREGHGSAVLIRALEPVQGINAKPSGPGLVCRALDVDLRHYGIDLTGSEIFLLEGGLRPGETIVATPRIGVGYAGSWAQRDLRFLIAGNPWVSGKKGTRRTKP